MQQVETTERIYNLTSWDDACDLAADLYGTIEKCDGTIEQAFIAGWVNTADMIESNEVDSENWSRVSELLLCEVKNMSYLK